MKKRMLVWGAAVLILMSSGVAWGAYHHEGERDAATFLTVYPEMEGTKLDHCALCHSGGEIEKRGKTIKLGSCQWCHEHWGYHGEGGGCSPGRDPQHQLSPEGKRHRRYPSVP